MPKLARNSHSLSHYRMLTHDMGYLVPCGVMEVLPGDKFDHRSRALMRVQPLLKPVMHPVEVRIHHWFVPNRLIWDQWDAFITARDPELTVPTITLTDQARGSLADHLGIPCDGSTDYVVSALPFYAYNAIYNFAYRDQDLIPEVALDSTTLQRVAWEKDKFTTARAQAQAGAAISIPFQSGLQAPVRGIALEDTGGWDITSGTVNESGTGGVATTATNTDGGRWSSGDLGANYALKQDPDHTDFPDVYADLSAASGGGIDVNEFRSALAMQRLLEHRNRYGSRHEDYLRFLGIRPSDARLQNPEYLGGGKNVISFSEVLSTAEGSTLSVGDLAGHGISAVSTRPYRRFFEESGLVISLLSVRPRKIYTQLLERMWLRSTYTDFWQKELEAMGPQEIYTKELYALHPNATDVFGYNGRHDEYRHQQSYVSGEFRDGGTEVDWHMGEIYDTSPALNASFINCVPTDRIYADTVTPELYTNVSHTVRAIRAVSKVAAH